MPIATRPFPALSPVEQLTLFHHVQSFEPTRFPTFGALRDEYAGPAYDHGRQQYSLWDNGRLRGAIALVTLEVETKGEAYMVGAYAHDPETFEALITHAFAAFPSPRPLAFKLGLPPGSPQLAEYARTLGFEQYDAALVLTLDPQATFPADDSLTWEPLGPGNRAVFEAIWNQTLALAPNGGSLTEVDLDELLAGTEHCGVLSMNGVPIAFAQLAVRQEVGWIEAIGIAPDYQGQGLGRRLVGHCAEQLRAHGASSIRLLVMRSNEPALRLYRKVGFGRDEVKGLWWRRTVTV